MPFHVKAYIDDHVVSAVAGTAKEAFAKAVEWHVVNKLADVSIGEGVRNYSIAEFSAIIAQGRPARSAKGAGKLVYYPTPELPDDTPLKHVRLSTRIRRGLEFGGLKTVGEVRSASDALLLNFQDLGKGSLRHLRETLGTAEEMTTFAIKRRWTSEEVKKVDEFLNAGKEAAEIAVLLNRSRQAVYALLQRRYRKQARLSTSSRRG